MTSKTDLYDFSHWDKLPVVSCQCITYGRPDLLEEAIESFLRQDYPGPMELSILNDCPTMVLDCDAPRVEIENIHARYNSIGAKRNACVNLLCKGEIILPWDDDDISLPWRVSTVVEEMRNHRYFKPAHYWFMSGADLRPNPTNQGVAHAMCGFSKKMFQEVGGYDLINSGQDTTFENKMRATEFRDAREIALAKTYYIYRWGTGHYHLSGYGYDSQEGFDRIGRSVEGSGRTREIKLIPKWRQDYEQLVTSRIPRRWEDR